MISRKEMMLNPRQRPKSPPREAMKSTGPIRMLLSSSVDIEQWIHKRRYNRCFSHPWLCLCQRRCWQQQYLPPRRCSNRPFKGKVIFVASPISLNHNLYKQGTKLSHRCVGHKQVVFVPFPQWAWQAWNVRGERVVWLNVGFVCLKMISMVCIMCIWCICQCCSLPTLLNHNFGSGPLSRMQSGLRLRLRESHGLKSFKATVFENCTINIISLTSGRWCWQNDECRGVHNPGDSHNLTLRCSSSLPKSFGIEPCWKYNFLIFWSPAACWPFAYSVPVLQLWPWSTRSVVMFQVYHSQNYLHISFGSWVGRGRYLIIQFKTAYFL